MKFVIIYTPGKYWIQGAPFTEQDLFEHGQYMQELFNKGILVKGGPFLDSEGGLAIVEVESEDEAVKIAENDPAVINGVFNAAVHSWMDVNWQGNI